MVSYLNDSPLKFIEIRPTRFSISHPVTFYTLKRRCYTVALWSASRKTIYAFQAQSSTSKIFGQAIGIRIRIRIPNFREAMKLYEDSNTSLPFYLVN